MRFAPQRRAFFRHQNFKKCSEHEVFCTFWLQNVLPTWLLFCFSTVHIVGSLLFKLPSMRWVRMVLVTPTYLGKKTFNSELQTTNSRELLGKESRNLKICISCQIIIFHQPRFPWKKGFHFPYFSPPFGGPKTRVWGLKLIWPGIWSVFAPKKIVATSQGDEKSITDVRKKMKTSESPTEIFNKAHYIKTGWWLNQPEKYESNFEHFSRDRGENKKSLKLKPPTSPIY